MKDEAQQEALASIAELHRLDREASLAGDATALLALWSEDPIAMPPDGPVQRGREALWNALSRSTGPAGAWETVAYEQEFGEVVVVGEYAWDWGTFRGVSRHRETGDEVSSHGKLLRILKRAPDGSWKVHRSMWSVAPRSGARP